MKNPPPSNVAAQRGIDHSRGPAAQVDRQSTELDYFVRALSHDMTANFMLLEESVLRLKRDHAENPLAELSAGFAHVEACLRESKRFLDDLVLLGKTGRVDMHAELVDLGPLVRDVLFELQTLLDARGVAVRVADRLPSVWCNGHRVRQVVTNLIRNAALHGRNSREPRIEIESLDALAPLVEGYVWLCVRDNGPGIPAESRREVFLPGKRLLGGDARGSGMGLAIVRRVIAHYGGTIFIDPVCAEGAAFVFSLPAAGVRNEATVDPPVQAVSSGPHLRLRRVSSGRRRG